MSYPPSVYKTWVAGETLTAADLNNSTLVIPNSNIPEDIDDYSVNTAEMQTTADPYPAAVVSLATSLSEEITRLRYILAQITGMDYWYVDPNNVLGPNDLTCTVAGRGLVVKTPDGTHTYRIAISDAGELTTEQVS